MQIVHSSRRGSRIIEHLGSAHSPEEVEALKAVAAQRLVEGQAQLDLGLEVAAAASSGGPLEITSSRMGHLLDALSRAYDALGFGEATNSDEVFRQLELAGSRAEQQGRQRPSPRRSGRRGADLLSHDQAAPTGLRAAVVASGAGSGVRGTRCPWPGSLVLYDVTTLNFETHDGDADAGMVSEANREAIEDAGLSYIIGARIPEEPYHVKKWRRDHPGQDIPDGHIFAARGPRPGRNSRLGAVTKSPTAATRRLRQAQSARHRHPDRQARTGSRREGAGEA